MVSRIKQLLDWQQLSPTQFADRIGIGRPVVSHILSERNKPSLDVVQRIIAAFPELSLPWLLSGSGDMLATVTAAAPASPATILTEPPAAAPTTAVPIALAEALPAAASVAPAVPARPPVAATVAPVASLTAESRRPAVASAPAFRVATAGRPAPAPRPVAAPPPPRFRPVEAAGPEPTPLATPVASGDAAPIAAAPTAAAGAADSSGTPAPGTLAAPGPAAEAAPPGSLLASLGEPGKAIRRIVIFYRDGSFADYQPEG